VPTEKKAGERSLSLASAGETDRARRSSSAPNTPLARRAAPVVAAVGQVGSGDFSNRRTHRAGARVRQLRGTPRSTRRRARRRRGRERRSLVLPFRSGRHDSERRRPPRRHPRGRRQRTQRSVRACTEPGRRDRRLGRAQRRSRTTPGRTAPPLRPSISPPAASHRPLPTRVPERRGLAIFLRASN
jgi:hypothetical protein